MKIYAMDDGKLLLTSILFLSIIFALIGRVDVIRLLEVSICGPVSTLLPSFGHICGL